MINRRHIRTKVMQSVYAMVHAKSDNLVKEEKFLRLSIDKMYDLYVLSLDMLLRVHQHAETNLESSKKKYLATKEELNPNTKFINNKAMKLLKESTSLLDYIDENNLNNWYLNSSYVVNIYKALVESDLYKEYMADEVVSFKKDKKFVVKFFEEFIDID